MRSKLTSKTKCRPYFITEGVTDRFVPEERPKSRTMVFVGRDKITIQKPIDFVLLKAKMARHPRDRDQTPPEHLIFMIIKVHVSSLNV